MKLSKLGKMGPLVSRLGIGCMGMSELYGKPEPREKSIAMLKKAFEHGVNFFDTADMYGKGLSEQMLGEAVADFRDKVVIATKCGLYRTDSEVGKGLATDTINSPEYIKSACDLSLKNLGMTYIDVYYLHRHNPETPIEESMRAMQDLISEGKIRYVGLSEVNSDTIRRAHAVLGDKLIAVQTEYSFINRNAANAVLPTCRELGIAFVSYSPFARGLLTGRYRDPSMFGHQGFFDIKAILPQYQPGNLERNLELVDTVARIASKRDHTAAQCMLAWLLAQGDDVFIIPGMSSTKHLQENIQAVDLVLSDEEMCELETAYKAHPVVGERMPKELLDALQLTP
jgi:aryl-alcohol dehydrogenase-like predicted oxidoreductase